MDGISGPSILKILDPSKFAKVELTFENGTTHRQLWLKTKFLPKDYK
jgi:hypothetical protein